MSGIKGLNLGMFGAVERGIKKARKNVDGEFDGLRGRLPDGTSVVLSDIVAYLRQYLLEEKGFAKALSRRKSSRRASFLAVRSAQDDGVRVAVDVLDSIASAVRLGNKQAARLLLSGSDGVRGEKVREGGRRRGADIKAEHSDRIFKLKQRFDELAQLHPKDSHRILAEQVALEFDCHERTVRRYTQHPRGKLKRDTTS